MVRTEIIFFFIIFQLIFSLFATHALALPADDSLPSSKTSETTDQLGKLYNLSNDEVKKLLKQINTYFIQENNLDVFLNEIISDVKKEQKECLDNVKNEYKDNVSKDQIVNNVINAKTENCKLKSDNIMEKLNEEIKLIKQHSRTLLIDSLRNIFSPNETNTNTSPNSQ